MYTEQSEWGLKRSLSSSTKWKKISWSNKSKTETSTVTYLGGKKKRELFEETNTVSHILQQCIKL